MRTDTRHTPAIELDRPEPSQGSAPAARIFEHGGDLSLARGAFGEPAGGWLDLSTGINTEAYPVPDIDARHWRLLPQRDAEQSLRVAAARAYGAPSPAHVLPVAGSQQALALLPLAFPERDAVVFGRTYAEYAARWTAARGRVTVVERMAEFADSLGAGKVGFLCNPNNPDGSMLGRETVLALAREVCPRGLLVVDEAFIDATPGNSVGAEVAGTRALVLRSFGKFFGLAGLRLGFAIADPEVLEPLHAVQGPWALSGPAMAAGEIALSDRRWVDRARRDLHQRRQRLDELLERAGFVPAGGTAFFAMLEDERVPELFERLAVRGVWTRRFAERPLRLRIGIPAHDDFARLERALFG